MSVLVIGDLHYRKNNKMTTDIVERDILNIITQRNPMFIVILGDTFNDHNKLWLPCYMRVCKFFDAIASLGKHIFLLIGNHDREDNKVYMTDEHFFYGHKYNTNITVIDRNFVYELQRSNDRPLRICFVPYVPPNKLNDSFIDSNIDPTTIDIFFGHVDIHNSKTEKLAKASWPEWPSNYGLMISGHVHDKEIVSNNFIYVGTPYQSNFGECQSKGVYLMDIFAQNFPMERIPLSVPVKKKVTVHYTQLETLILEPNVEIKLEITGSKKQAKELMNRYDMRIKFAGIKYSCVGETEVNLQVPTLSQNTNFYNHLVNSIYAQNDLFPTFKDIFYDINGNLVL